eukprot:m.47017 g.47017  ORF g.47017 m.47017 type:complete len:239 (-) comp11211_c0_seq1:21-737(-)
MARNTSTSLNLLTHSFSRSIFPSPSLSHSHPLPSLEETDFGDEEHPDIAALLSGRVPPSWAQFSLVCPPTLAQWLSTLTAHMQCVRELLVQSRPSEFWLGAFLHPHAFLAAVRQEYADDTGAGLHEIVLDVAAPSLLPASQSTTSVLLTGLYLHGASWNGALAEMRPREVYSPLPPLRLQPTTLTTARPNTYSCPVYPSATRARGRRAIFAATLPCADTEFWLLRGVAALLHPFDVSL